MNEKIKQLSGANMDIDLASQGEVDWKQAECPWNKAEKVTIHKCAVKDTSICRYFCGIKYLDSVLCSYPYENLDVLTRKEMDRDIKRKSLPLGEGVTAQGAVTDEGQPSPGGRWQPSGSLTVDG